MARRNTTYPQPIVPVEQSQLVRFLQDELARISDAIGELSRGHISASAVAPARPMDGDIRYADGTNWDPGSGEGLYAYFNGAWNEASYIPAATQLSSTVNQVPANTDPTLITFNSEDHIEGISHNSGVVTLETGGLYHIIHGAQVAKASGTGALSFDMWFNLNGSTVANSNVRAVITNTSDSQVLVLSIIDRFAAGDVLRSYQQVSTTSGSPGLYATAASGDRPVTPSIISTFAKIG